MLLFFFFPKRKYKGGCIPGKRVEVLRARMMTGPSNETEQLLLKGNVFRKGFHITLQPEGPILHQSVMLEMKALIR